MRNASALSRFVAPMIAVGIVLCGCGQASTLPPPNAGSSSAVPSATPGRLPATGGSGMPVAAGAATTRLGAGTDPADLPAGSIYHNPANGRDEVVVADIRRTAVLIGDSQAEPSSGWPRQGLAAVGYDVYFCGLGGTGYVASNGKTGNYIDALQRGDWKLPYGTPPLVVLEGGGNDATRGATDAQIVANAERLIASIQQRYPAAKLAMIGTLARGANYGGGRRTQVDALLGTVAQKHGLPFVGAGDWLTRYELTNSMADGVHLNQEGHKALGAILGKRLRAMGLAATETSHAPR